MFFSKKIKCIIYKENVFATSLKIFMSLKQSLQHRLDALSENMHVCLNESL